LGISQPNLETVFLSFLREEVLFIMTTQWWINNAGELITLKNKKSKPENNGRVEQVKSKNKETILEVKH
jgi:hypothetical protein